MDCTERFLLQVRLFQVETPIRSTSYRYQEGERTVDYYIWRNKRYVRISSRLEMLFQIAREGHQNPRKALPISASWILCDTTTMPIDSGRKVGVLETWEAANVVAQFPKHDSIRPLKRKERTRGEARCPGVCMEQKLAPGVAGRDPPVVSRTMQARQPDNGRR
jgi:hypothetical protein